LLIMADQALVGDVEQWVRGRWVVVLAGGKVPTNDRRFIRGGPVRPADRWSMRPGGRIVPSAGGM
jgi:hypothetical protein